MVILVFLFVHSSDTTQPVVGRAVLISVWPTLWLLLGQGQQPGHLLPRRSRASLLESHTLWQCWVFSISCSHTLHCPGADTAPLSLPGFKRSCDIASSCAEFKLPDFFCPAPPSLTLSSQHFYTFICSSLTLLFSHSSPPWLNVFLWKHWAPCVSLSILVLIVLSESPTHDGSRSSAMCENRQFRRSSSCDTTSQTEVS